MKKPGITHTCGHSRHHLPQAEVRLAFFQRYNPPIVALGKNGKVRTRAPVSLA